MGKLTTQILTHAAINIGALIIRIWFWGSLYVNNNTNNNNHHNMESQNSTGNCLGPLTYAIP